MSFTIRPAAREDILQQFRYYLIEKDAESAAEDFLESVQQAIKEVCRHPEMGAPRIFKNAALQGLRTWTVKGFPSMRIYYLWDGSMVSIVRVLHGKRNIHPLLEDDASSI